MDSSEHSKQPPPQPQRPLQLVWLKRDLRLSDHTPLADAVAAGPTLLLYIHEPAWWAADDFDPAHLAFVLASLDELRGGVGARGGRLIERIGDAVEVLDALRAELSQTGWPLATLRSHEEVGVRWTWDRDKAVARWARQHGVAWHESPRDGVIRRLQTRDGWARKWKARMSGPLVEPPERVGAPSLPEGHTLWRIERPAHAEAPEVLAAMSHQPIQRSAPLSTLWQPERSDWLCETSAALQPAGELAAERALATFLQARGVGYRADMSSPVTGWAGCSRLSPHLAWGNVSMHTVYLRTRARVEEVRATKKAGDVDLDKRWPQSLASFEKRLRWQSHFMQKLEDAPDLDTAPIHPGFVGLRTRGSDEDDGVEHALEEDERQRRLQAWQRGQTGYPMVDACMRAVAATGWLNFRMRAMVESFAAYHLWLPWQDTGRYLARCFLDYEPGIHWSQIQMQSGVTGINAVRIYSPAKQVRDQDPTGVFIRHWVPELRAVSDPALPDHALPEPHLWDGFGSLDYPAPIVDHREAYDAARKRVYAWRRRPEVKALTPDVLEKHGSRRRASRRGRRSRR